jgi:hypothetical protein
MDNVKDLDSRRTDRPASAPLSAELLADVAELLENPELTDGFGRVAACRGTTVDFFPDDEDYTAPRRLCAGCPVVAECLAEELRWPVPQPGMWAGLTQEQRGDVRATLRTAGAQHRRHAA